MTTIFPAAALANHIAILGKTGSGKTSTAKLIVEQIVDDGDRVCILDPLKSDWWGLISSADGKTPGLPFQILGGPRAERRLPESDRIRVRNARHVNLEATGGTFSTYMSRLRSNGVIEKAGDGFRLAPELRTVS